jgi:outer membrane protein assembly factor BamB
MSPAQMGERRELRLWPGVVAVTLQWLVRFGVPLFLPDATIVALIGEAVGALAVLIWWIFFSRVPHLERWGALLLIAAAVAATPRVLDPSIVTGMMGLMFRIYVVPGVCLALVVWAALSRRLTAGTRRLALVAAILIACGAWALVRTEGMSGAGNAQLVWRWAESAEQKLVARSAGEAPAPASPPAPRTNADWPGFRGPNRDDIVTGVRIKTDWTKSPPVQLWRRPVGPGWSSFAVHDGVFYTQEQRGNSELVACYDVATGKPVWTHSDAARFWESNAGAGPRATPTLYQGRLYTFGATGILNALDASNGSVVWTHNAASDTGAKVPDWGFSASPLVIDDVVIVAASGRLAAYDRASGHLRWHGPNCGGSYSSPHLLNIGGVPQVLLLSSTGVTSIAPADGSVLWKHSWPGFTIVQPAMTSDGGVLITTGGAAGGAGIRRLTVAHGSGGWTAEEKWTSPGLKPYFNDYVIHQGYAFGFDGSILACIDLKDGTRKWKGGRYGYGQLLLLSDQNLLLVVTEEGELALVEAVPDKFTEVARVPAIEGKTWNHPVLAGDTLLVRNGQEMIAFRLSTL